MDVDGLTRGTVAQAYSRPAAPRPAPAENAAPRLAPAENAAPAETAQVRKAEEPRKEPQHESEAAEHRLGASPADSLLKKAIEQANKKLVGQERELQYSVHEQTGRVMIKVMARDDGTVIREIPPEHTLDEFAKVLELAGLMVDEKR